MAPLFSYALLALFARCTLATVSSTSYQLCTTKFGTSPKTPLPSTIYILALTFHPTLVIKSTPVTTVTPTPTTTTVTYTQSVTTSVANTVITSTSTSTEIDTSTTTQTTTFTSTITTGTTTTLPQSTSTIPTPSEFTYPSPVPSPPIWPDKCGAIDLSLPERRSDEQALEARGSNPSGVTSCHKGPSGPTYSPARYPTSVICGELIEVFSTSTIVSTASTTSTVSAPRSTITSSTTTTSTSTVYYAASATTTTTTTTITYSTTTVPTTTTTTITSTATVSPPAATFYAACAPANIPTPPPTYFFSGEYYNPGTNQMSVQTPDDTEYDCCVSCLTQPGCKVAEYFSPAEVAGTEYPCTQDFGASYTSCDGGEAVTVYLSSLGEAVYNTSVSAFSNCGGSVSFGYD